jgi:cation diffusion facilitator CzcD-associated flavoprotein CzcO
MTDVMNRSETTVRERFLVTAERLFREIGIRRLRSPTTMCGYRVVVATGAYEAPFCPLIARAVESSILQMFPADYRRPEQLPRRAP